MRRRVALVPRDALHVAVVVTAQAQSMSLCVLAAGSAGIMITPRTPYLTVCAPRRWCCGDMTHFDTSYWAMTKVRVSCASASV